MQKPRPIVVELTAQQDAAMEHFMYYLHRVSAEGKPGILSAQIFPGHMRVGIISYEEGIAAIKAAGGNPEERIRIAPELTK